MPVLYQKMIHRADLRANPRVLYLFGDNNRRIGHGGQAKEMRGEPNAIGIRTKETPGVDESAYWREETEEDYYRFTKMIDEDFESIYQMMKHGHNPTVVIPIDGLGTGLARLDKDAPATLGYIKKWLKVLASGGTDPRPDPRGHLMAWAEEKLKL